MLVNYLKKNDSLGDECQEVFLSLFEYKIKQQNTAACSQARKGVHPVRPQSRGRWLPGSSRPRLGGWCQQLDGGAWQAVPFHR